MKRNVVVCCLCFLFVVVAGCKKSVVESHAPPAGVDDEIQNRILLIKTIAGLLEDVYMTDPRAAAEVSAAIASAYYEDERVLLKDLLSPSESLLYQSEAFAKLNADTGIFRRTFCEILMKDENRPALNILQRPIVKRRGALSSTVSSDARLGLPVPLADLQIDTSLAIYFPYSNNFPEPRRLTIVAADREADSGPGRQLGVCLGRACARDVVVDDEYADENPTHIVTVGAKPRRIAKQETSDAINRVFHGWSKLTRQMDKLISFTGNGGGSEIKIARIDGYLQREDQQVQDFSGDVITVHYSRGDIRKNKWKRVYSIWDGNWRADNEEQVYAVYEEDTQGEKTFSGTLTTTVNLPGKPSPGKTVGEIGFKITVLTQDEILTQRRLDRTSYVRTALVNQGWGFYEDVNQNGRKESWPIYDGAAVWQYTLPMRLQ